MYKCLNCNTEFEEPSEKREYMCECHGSPYYEPVNVCPDCRSERFEKVNICNICGEVIGSNNAKYRLSDETFCENCIGEALKQEYQNLDFEEKLEVLGFEVI